MKHREAFLAMIDFDGCVVIQSTDDNDHVTAIDCVNFSKGSSLDDIDERLAEAGYEIARFDYIGLTLSIAIVCCTTWEPVSDSA